MRSILARGIVVAAILLSAASISFAQDSERVPEDRSVPPHEDLFRAQESISAVLCKAPTKAVEQRRLDRKYKKRISLVHISVAKEFGETVANSELISVLPCARFRSDSKFKKALREAEQNLSDVLEKWELRYGINANRTSEILPLWVRWQRVALTEGG